MEDIVSTAKNITEGRTENSLPEPKRPSMLEQAREMREQNEKLLVSMQEERQQMEKLLSDIAISGKSFAGSAPKEETQQDKDKTEAAKYLAIFGRNLAK